MFEKILPFLPGVGVALLGAALQVSGYTNIDVAFGLGVLALVSFAIPGLYYGHRWLRSRSPVSIGVLLFYAFLIGMPLFLFYISAYSAKHKLDSYNLIDRNNVPVEQGYAECEYAAVSATASNPQPFAANSAITRLITACMQQRGY